MPFLPGQMLSQPGARCPPHPSSGSDPHWGCPRNGDRCLEQRWECRRRADQKHAHPKGQDCKWRRPRSHPQGLGTLDYLQSPRGTPLWGSATERHLPYPVVGRPRCFMRFLTSSDSSCLSERRYRLRRCWLIHSAVLLECLLPFLLSRRAHCMLLRRSSGCSDWSLEHEFLWWLVLMPQCSFTSFVSSQSSTLMEICDWKPGR